MRHPIRVLPSIVAMLVFLPISCNRHEVTPQVTEPAPPWWEPEAKSLLLDDHKKARQNEWVSLPARYRGPWGFEGNPQHYSCVVQDPDGSLRIVGGRPDDVVYQNGFVFQAGGEFYAYVIATQINLATGNLIRFSSRDGELRNEYLDLDSVVRHLEESGIPVRGDTVVTVEFHHVVAVLEAETIGVAWRPIRLVKLSDTDFECVGT